MDRDNKYVSLNAMTVTRVSGRGAGDWVVVMVHSNLSIGIFLMEQNRKLRKGHEALKI